MTANSLRSFAGGLMMAATVCGAVYFFGVNDVSSTQAEETLTVAEMKTSLAEDGYHIYTEEEWQEHLAAITAEVYEEAEANGTQGEESQEEENEVSVEYRTKLILTVSSGMTSIDVGNALVRAEIIDNSMAFFNEVERRGLANALRPGTFEIDSNMSLDEIISIIFR
ncbi:endolytic transglycosylase MltG [Alkalihalobacillus sp. MEB130]|uniref:hypothetical protein n=1 Tax=Alkalihalobacillus sp. MEB130 TaxID=2976704 RepID=UPI0028DE7C6F|nr:hypothetical protein [Alkalihalobacillus sp. MEB130]MDT8861409.1 endolytic transglycosylase MltG [Alkalihalobacillus sp. MEB130]